MGIEIRRASAADAALIAHQRGAMFTEMGEHTGARIEEAAQRFAAWVAPRIESGEYIGLLACEGDTVRAGLGLWWIDWPPGPGTVRDGTTLRGYIMNVYTEPDQRGQGLATRLMQAALDLCRERGVKRVILHASEQGRPVYERLGFTATNEMKLQLD